MMSSVDFEAYERFVTQHRKRIRGISRSTEGEHSPEDVASEALLIAIEIAGRAGESPDFDDPDFQDRLLRHLYQHLVKYDEKVVRYAVRLDKPVDGEAVALDDHPALRRRIDADSSLADPLESLLMREQEFGTALTLTPHQSRAAAYVHLLARCGNSMRTAASALRISRSYCYFRFNEAKLAASFQEDLRPIIGDDSFLPGPWRAFRAASPRRWKQLPLDFSASLC